jgi:hypothetical protein
MIKKELQIFINDGITLGGLVTHPSQGQEHMQTAL